MQSKLVTRTHNGYHLGDNLVHLHFLRKVALANPDRKFVHAAQWNYLPQLLDITADVPNLSLTDINYMTPADSINAWRGAGGFWYSHAHRNDFVKFHTEYWFPYLASQMFVDNPIQSANQMLFDYPAIQHSLNGQMIPGCDILVINSAPGSGQFRSYDQFELAILADALSAQGHAVVVTDDYPKNLPSTKRLGYSVTQIGQLSLQCHTILMISTGPSWPTFNVWNRDSIKLRIILLDSERVNIAPNTRHCSKVDEAAEILKEAGLL